ncbi:MAG: ABC transporter ATP-binding protein [Lachnospiraceae bacterium]|jgi:ABC-type multidrug transport system fused ATPase/permease subunit|nr:ABC transporter ATP-binding protein [Lachnospiraceae bacterium]
MSEKNGYRFHQKLKLIMVLTKKAVSYAPSYLPMRVIQLVLQIFAPFLISVFPALILDELAVHNNLQKLLLLTLVTVFLGGISGLMDYLLRRRLSQDAFVINQKIELSINEAFIRMDYEKLEDQKVQELSQLARDTNNHASSLESMISTFFSMIGQCISLVGMAAILSRLLFTDGKVEKISGVVGWLARNSVICLLIALALCLISSRMNGLLLKVYERYDKKFAALGREYKYYGQLARDEIYVKDIRTFRLYNLINRRIEHYCQRNKKLMDEVNIPEIFTDMTGNLMMALELVIVYAMVSSKVRMGVISIGEFYLYISAITQVISLVRAVFENKNSIDRCLMYQQAYCKIEELAEKSIWIKEREEIHKECGNTLVFEHVTFAYPGTDKQVIDDVSFTLHPGEKLALVGRNGAGKTTLVKLMLGLYKPQKGRILWNGQEIGKLPYEEYIHNFSAVFQDFKLIASSIAENVAMEEVWDEEKVKKSLYDAGFSSLLASLKEGVFTQLLGNFNQESVNLSGGEAQKIAIARAFYKEAPILILDEPTAALDPIAEQDIFIVIRKKLQGQSAIFISHRLSSCRICDRILVLDNGKILQDGSHNVLAAKNGLYQTMWKAQKGFYMEEENGAKIIP